VEETLPGRFKPREEKSIEARRSFYILTRESILFDEQRQEDQRSKVVTMDLEEGLCARSKRLSIQNERRGGETSSK